MMSRLIQDYETIRDLLVSQRQALLKFQDQRLKALDPLISRYQNQVMEHGDELVKLPPSDRQRVKELIGTVKQEIESNLLLWQTYRDKLSEAQDELRAARRLAREMGGSRTKAPSRRLDFRG